MDIQSSVYGTKEDGGSQGNFSHSAQHQFGRGSTEHPTVFLAHARHPNHTTDSSAFLKPSDELPGDKLTGQRFKGI